MCLLSSHAASGHVHFCNFICVHKEGHVAGHNYSLEGYHKRPEMQKWPGHDCMKKSSVHRTLKSPAPLQIWGLSVATGIQEVKSFSLKESTAVSSRLVKSWGSSNVSPQPRDLRDGFICLYLHKYVSSLSIYWNYALSSVLA